MPRPSRSSSSRMFGLVGPWINVLEEGMTLFVDELHGSLHPLLVRFLVTMFHELKKYIPDYSKGSRATYSQTKDQLEQAKRLAVQANRSAASRDSNSSHTLVVDVVQALQNLRVQMDT